jgi:GDPmannose 4,6-dehydratase
MWRMLQQPVPADYVLATGELHSVQDIVELAFETVQLDWRKHVVSDPRFLRPAEPHRLVGNAEKARRELHWQPSRTFHELIADMTGTEVERLRTARRSGRD